MTKVCITTGVVTFILLVYCCVGIDYLPHFITIELLSNPLFRFIVLALMAIAYCYDPYITIVIGFAYLLTKFNLIYNQELSELNTPPVLVINDNVNRTNTQSKEDVFTTQQQYEDAQSNIVDETALKTEIRTWTNGYGTQSGSAN